MDVEEERTRKKRVLVIFGVATPNQISTVDFILFNDHRSNFHRRTLHLFATRIEHCRQAKYELMQEPSTRCIRSSNRRNLHYPKELAINDQTLFIPRS